MITITVLREYDDVYVVARHYPVDRTSPFYGKTLAECTFSRADRTSARKALHAAIAALLVELGDDD